MRQFIAGESVSIADESVNAWRRHAYRRWYRACCSVSAVAHAAAIGSREENRSALDGLIRQWLFGDQSFQPRFFLGGQLDHGPVLAGDPSGPPAGVERQRQAADDQREWRQKPQQQRVSFKTGF